MSTGFTIAAFQTIRLLLRWKGTMSELELTLMRRRLVEGGRGQGTALDCAQDAPAGRRAAPTFPAAPTDLRRPARPSDEGGFDVVVEFCWRSANCRSKSAIRFFSSVILLA
jgi:hypothetical protein